MSKSKNIDNEGLVGKIVFRVVAALIALTVIPAGIFLPLFKVVAESSLIQFGVGETMSLSDISAFIKLDDISNIFAGESGQLSDEVRGIIPPLVCFAVFFLLTWIMSVVIFFFAVFSNKKKVILFESLGGIIFSIASIISFSNAAAPILDGTVSLSDLFGGGLLAGIVSVLVKVNTLQLASAPFVIIFIFVAIAAWAGAFVMTEVGEKK